MAPEHDALDFDQTAATLILPDLAIHKVGGDLPDALAGIFGLKPMAKVGGQRVEIEPETIGREDREGEAGLQAVVQFVDDGIREVEGARAEADDGDDLGGSVESRPDPDVLVGLTDIGQSSSSCTWTQRRS